MGRISYQSIIGDRFGKLTVQAIADEKTADGRTMLVCRCDCGGSKHVNANTLKRGLVNSCGCLRSEASGRKTHGKRNTRAFAIWSSMRQRCENPNSKQFSNYGGRGITVCERWQKFENFLADMGEPAEGLTIDRNDNDKGYEPGNCRWATRIQQNLNRRSVKLHEVEGQKLAVTQIARRYELPKETVRTRIKSGMGPIALHDPRARFIEHEGLRLTVAEWSRRTGIPASTLNARLRRGDTPESVLRAPDERFGSHRLIEFNGITQDLTAWARQIGVKPVTLHARLRLGWSVERALTEPVQAQQKKAKPK